jgi:hypothetical protein
VNVRRDAPDASRAQLTEHQRRAVARARLLHASIDNEIGVQLTLGHSPEEAVAYVLGAARYQLGEMLALVEKLTGGGQ